MQLLTVRETVKAAFDLTGRKYSETTIYAWVRRGKLMAMKIGNAVMIPLTQLQIFLSPKTKSNNHVDGFQSQEVAQ